MSITLRRLNPITYLWLILHFDKLYKKLSPRFHLVDTFSNYFSFHIVNCKDIDAKTAYCSKLNKIYEESFLNPNTVLIISNTSIKNKVVTLISYV